MSDKTSDAINSIRNSDVKAMVVRAIKLGWTASVASGGTLSIHSPAPPGGRAESITIPGTSSGVKDRVLRTWQRKIARYADPELLAELAKREESIAHDDEAIAKLREYYDTHDTSEELKTAQLEIPTPQEMARSEARIAEMDEQAHGPDTREAPETSVGKYEALLTAEGKYQCPDCDTQWASVPALRGHRKVHAYQKRTAKRPRYEDALVFIIEAAQEALGGDVRHEDVEKLERDLAAEKEAHALTQARLSTVQGELDAIKTKVQSLLS